MIISDLQILFELLCSGLCLLRQAPSEGRMIRERRQVEDEGLRKTEETPPAVCSLIFTGGTPRSLYLTVSSDILNTSVSVLLR